MYSKKLTCVVVLMLAGWWLVLGRSLMNKPSSAAGGLDVVAISELGNVGRPANVFNRDGGASGMLGGQMLWVFGDTLYHATSAPTTPAPSNWRSATAGLANLGNPLALSESQEPHGIPYQLLPYTTDELNYNLASGNPSERYALWPKGVVPLNGQTSLIFYNYLKVHAALNYEILGIGTARIAAGQIVATRGPGLLFGANEPSFKNVMVQGGTVYLYSTTGQVAKAPLGQAEARGAYTFWNGSGWTGDVNAAKSILYVVGSLSVHWNPAVDKYVAIYLPAGTNKVYYRVADHPEGPWTTQQFLYDTPPPSPATTLGNYALEVHPELALDGRNIFISYFRSEGGGTGNLHLVKIQLRNNANPATPQSNPVATAPSGNPNASTPGSSGSTSGASSAAKPGQSASISTNNSLLDGTASTKTSQQSLGQKITHPIDTIADISSQVQRSPRNLWTVGILITLLIGVLGVTIDRFLAQRKELAHHFPTKNTPRQSRPRRNAKS